MIPDTYYREEVRNDFIVNEKRKKYGLVKWIC